MTKLEQAKRLYKTCQHLSLQSRPYTYGGGHTKPLAEIKITDGLDCSSSVALALARNDMWEDRFAWTSGDMALRWGVPGKGRYVTMWARGGSKGKAHVWLQFHGLGRAWRFDTSPWGGGGRGPRMRLLPRPTAGFTPRHWPGM